MNLYEKHPARREYYEEREHKNAELVEAMIYAGIWLVIAGGLISIIGHVRELWLSLVGSF